MQSYLTNLQDILTMGCDRGDRTGTGTRSVFGLQTRYDLRSTFPAVTTKRLAWKAVISELLWFLEGSNDERRLAEILHGTRDLEKKTIWTGNAHSDYWEPHAKFPGDLGRVYGVQWRTWRSFNQLSSNEDDLIVGNYTSVDQVKILIDDIKNDPYSRRHILSAWNPGEINDMALPPCHVLAQFYIRPLEFDERAKIFHDKFPYVDGEVTEQIMNEFGVPAGALSCQMYQRSADMFLGVPFNIASYSILTHMIAQVTNLVAEEFIHTIGDAHIYNNHFDQVKTQLERDPLLAPTLWINPEVTDIDSFSMKDFKLIGYEHHDPIVAKMAV